MTEKKYSSIEEGKSRPMPDQYDGEHSKEKVEEREAKEEVATPPEPVEDKPVKLARDEPITPEDMVKVMSSTPEEIVEVPKSEFEEMKKSIEEMKSKSEFLETIADKKAKALYYQRNKDKLPTHVKLSTWKTEQGEKVVVEWRMLVDDGEFRDPQTGRRVERQTIEITLENERKVPLPYLTWVEQYGHTKCEQVGTETDEGGKLKLKLKRLDTGKVYVVGAEYVN